MKLSTAQCRRFYRLHDALIDFAGQRLDELGLPPATDGDEDPLTDVDFDRRLWGSPRLIDAFLNENPARFNDRELSAVAQWRSALFGVYHVVLLPNHQSIFLLDDQAFEVRGTAVQIDETLVASDQAIVFATLIPFDNSIVFAGRLHDTGLSLPYELRRDGRAAALASKAAGNLCVTGREFEEVSAAIISECGDARVA